MEKLVRNRTNTMNLEEKYRQVQEAIASLDFNRLWPGFKPLKFALYDEEKCFFDGHYIEKTDAFPFSAWPRKKTASIRRV